MARILMCRPDYYGIEYEINPWMSRSRGAVRERAQQQWQTLYETLLRLQVTVELLDPQPGLPDLVFTANAGLVFRDTVILSHFRYPQRQREEPVFENWFRQQGSKSPDWRRICFLKEQATRFFVAGLCLPDTAFAATAWHIRK
jgi:N-dimethylarginine dimethylaminohydrolase